MPPKPPSGKQLNYLRALAQRTGQTFTIPTTAAQASREIARLKTVKPSSRLDIHLERTDLAAERAAREANTDVPVVDAEIQGWGSSATWNQRS